METLKLPKMDKEVTIKLLGDFYISKTGGHCTCQIFRNGQIYKLNLTKTLWASLLAEFKHSKCSDENINITNMIITIQGIRSDILFKTKSGEYEYSKIFKAIIREDLMEMEKEIE